MAASFFVEGWDEPPPSALGLARDFGPRRAHSLDKLREHIVEKPRRTVIEGVPGHGADEANGANGEDLAASGDRYVDHVGSHHVGTVGTVGIRHRSAQILRHHEIFRSKARGRGEDGRLGRRAERKVISVAFVAGGAAENVAFLADHVLAHALEERSKSRLIARRGSLVAFPLRKTFRREADAGERVRTGSAIAPQAPRLAGVDMTSSAISNGRKSALPPLKRRRASRSASPPSAPTGIGKSARGTPRRECVN
jgi:hypothetical protein